MAEYLIQDTSLEAIADAINAKTGGSSAMTPAQMVTAIGSISGGGGGGVEVLHATVTATQDYARPDQILPLLKSAVGNKSCVIAVNRTPIPEGVNYFISGVSVALVNNNYYTLETIARQLANGSKGTGVWSGSIPVPTGSVIEVWGLDL